MANQSLGLVYLPEEIILQILRMVHDTPIPDFELRKRGYVAQEWALYNQGIRNIQNVRLTSRILSKVGSELLIEYVGVDLSWTSLYRFQRIMRHPGIRKGVGMVRIRLPFYDLKFCANEEAYKSEQLEFYPFLTNHYSVDMLGPEAKPFLHWLGGSRQDCPEWTQEKVNTAIKHSHREYRYRYESQVLLLSRRRKMFIQAVAKALKKSNNKALRVEITDRHDLPRQYRFVQSVQRAEEGNILDLYLKSPGLPRRWNVFADRPGDRPRCLASMVLEIQVTLESVVFHGARSLKSLEHFLQCVEPHKISITLDNCISFIGPWADVLDFMRSKQRKTCLIRPGGKEFGEIERGCPRTWPLLSPENAGPDMTKGSSGSLRMRCFDQFVARSQQYIRGDCDVNPLRRRPN